MSGHHHKHHRSRVNLGSCLVGLICGLVIIFAVLHYAGGSGSVAAPSGSSSRSGSQPSSTGGPSPTPTPASAAADPTSCKASGSGEMVLPDPHCTPGAVVASYTTAMLCRGDDPPRPPESVTEPEKIRSIAQYGDYDGSSAHAYEYDHLIPIELGGASTSANLWPEYDAGTIPNPKDRVENAAKRAVCDGRLTLAQAQQEIATNWITLGHQLGVQL